MAKSDAREPLDREQAQKRARIVSDYRNTFARAVARDVLAYEAELQRVERERDEALRSSRQMDGERLRQTQRRAEAEHRVARLEAQLAEARRLVEDRIEAWNQDADEADLAGNSYRGHDDAAAVDLFRSAARSRNRASEWLPLLAALAVSAETPEAQA